MNTVQGNRLLYHGSPLVFRHKPPVLSKYHKTKIKGKAYFPKVNFVRFADDFIVTGENPEILENGVKPIIVEFLKERGLELSEEKTLITHINDGFDFLGVNIKKYNGKLLTMPSKKNYKNVIEKIRKTIKDNPSIKQEDLIHKLNPIIETNFRVQKYADGRISLVHPECHTPLMNCKSAHYDNQ